MRIDSRLHCTDIANPLKLGGQQWRRREKRKLNRRRKRRSAARRSSQRRDRSSTSHVSKIASHGPAIVGVGSTIRYDGPAQVNDRGRRRDGGASFIIGRLSSVAKTEMGKPNLTPGNRQSCPSTISPTPSVRRRRMCRTVAFANALAFDHCAFDIGKLGSALRITSTAPFFCVRT